MVNKCFLLGRLGSDPELRTSRTGLEVVNVSLAVSASKDVTNWFRLVAFGEMAKRLNASTRKGSRIIVEGHLSQRTWEQDGHKRETVEVIVDNLTFTDPAPTVQEPKFEEQDDAGELPF